MIRVPAEHWRNLPPALVPLLDEYSAALRGTVVREGCDMHLAWGYVKCSNDWQVVSSAQ